MEMRRGFIFTLDALVAVVIAVMALAILMQMVSLKTAAWYKEISLYNSAQDFLTSSDKNGTLNAIFTSTNITLAISNLNASMASEIPSNMVARINVTIYRYNQTTSAFNVTASNITVQNVTTPIKSVVRRIFTDPTNNYYGIIVMETWYR
jgi:hypothetical protein